MGRRSGQLLWLKRLPYPPEPIVMARALGLRRILRHWYYRWTRPTNGILELRVGEVSAQFYVRTPEELRVLESAGGAGGEQRVLELLVSSLHAGDVVFDIGANVGLYSILLAKAVGNRGRVIAFEPESLSYEHLQENLKLNGLENVRCFRKALRDRNAQAKLYSSATIGSSTLVASDGTKDSAEVVDVVEGDSLVVAENLPLHRNTGS